MKLAEKEEKLLEMELVFDQSQKLADKLEDKVEGGKSDSLGLAKKVYSDNCNTWILYMFVKSL